jgi:hypothetical protein
MPHFEPEAAIFASFFTFFPHKSFFTKKYIFGGISKWQRM